LILRRRGRIFSIMPIYEYAPLEPPGCALCCYGFERLQPLSEPALTHCPACGGAIRRVLGAPHVQSGQSHVLREDHIAKHGFTQYRRIGKGLYEKTAGKGPDTISGD
jgi:putative FmdB family regulatory protein